MLELLAALILLSPQEPAAAEPRRLSPAEVEHRRANGESIDLVRLPPPVRGPIPPTEARGVFSQVEEHWVVHCDVPGFADQRVQIDVTLSSEGHVVGRPAFVNPDDDPVWRAAADSARSALIAAAPFEVPEGFSGGRYRTVFVAARVCARNADQP